MSWEIRRVGIVFAVERIGPRSDLQFVAAGHFFGQLFGRLLRLGGQGRQQQGRQRSQQ